MCKFLNLTLRELEENKDIKSGDLIKGFYKIVRVGQHITSTNQYYIKWSITDSSGITKELRTDWEFDEELLKFSSGIIQIIAKVDIYKNKKTYVLLRNEKTRKFMIRIPNESEIKDMIFEPKENSSLLKVEFTNYISEIKDADIRKLVETIVFSKEVEEIFNLPATKKFNHLKQGGLAKYILEVIEVSMLLSDKQDVRVDKDLIIAGAILSNVGKVLALDLEKQDYTLEYRALGASGLSIKMLYQNLSVVPTIDKVKLLLLENIIYSRSIDDVESIIKPISIEGHILNNVSNSVAKANSVATVLEKDGTIGNLTDYSTMHKQFFYKGADVYGK
jgi:23S rRNA maturation-related 3'-5' exoribonuclease YhaM